MCTIISLLSDSFGAFLILFWSSSSMLLKAIPKALLKMNRNTGTNNIYGYLAWKTK